MIISLQNILRVYDTYVKKTGGYLLTYKLSEDRLENFFSAVRSRGGFSNNPTCYQFIGIFKKLLTHADVKESPNANCIALDDTELLHVLPEEANITSDSVDDSINTKSHRKVDNYLSEENDSYGEGTNKNYIDNVVGHMAGSVVRSILKKIRCFQCPLLLTSDKSHSALLDRKNRGKLTFASR